MSTIVSNLSLSIQKAATAGLFALTALTVLGTSSAIAQQTAVQKAAQKPAAPVVAQQEEEETAVPNTPGAQGIKVHGHWVIDVKDKDGKIVEHRDFQNSLVANAGSQLLVQLLSGTFTPSNLEVDLSYSGTIQYYIFPATNNATRLNCSQNYPAQQCVAGLTQTANANGSAIVLQGQFTAPQTTFVDTVATHMGVCYAQSGASFQPLSPIAPQTCSSLPSGGLTFPQSSGYALFTSAALANQLTVAAGQTLAVTVTLSFS